MASKIEWTNLTWNPVTGCTKVSEWCRNCYADRLAKRLQKMWLKKYSNGFQLTMHPDTLDFPKKHKKPSLIFVNSMSDLFHKDVSTEYIKEVFKVMNNEKRHIFQVLTKRHERLLELSSELEWWENIWMWVSVEDSRVINRIDFLKKTQAKTKFISAEPLIWDWGNTNLAWIDWVIVWGESWPNSRPMEEQWVSNIQNLCTRDKVAFFFKQWWWINKKKTGRLLNWKTFDEYPKYFGKWIETYLPN